MIKNNRGFTFVELIVVVSIVALLTAISVPTYQRFQERAYETAYKSDLLSLHKAWRSFSTEKDSFLVRTTAPDQASIATVGMDYLFTSTLYGQEAGYNNFIGFKIGTSRLKKYDGGNYGSVDRTSSDWIVDNTGLDDDKRHNAIGVGYEADDVDQECKLEGKQYRMGVFGPVSGRRVIGYDLTHRGVFSERDLGTSLTVNAADQGKLCTDPP